MEYATRDQAQQAVNTLSNQNLMGRLVYVREVSHLPLTAVKCSSISRTKQRYIARIVRPSRALQALARLVGSGIILEEATEGDTEWVARLPVLDVKFLSTTLVPLPTPSSSSTFRDCKWLTAPWPASVQRWLARSQGLVSSSRYAPIIVQALLSLALTDVDNFQL